MEDKELKMETKCYDANEYGYLYGLNKRIPDDEFEKVKSYMRDLKDTGVLKRMCQKLKRFSELKTHLKKDKIKSKMHLQIP